MGAVDFTEFVKQAPRSRKPLTATAAYDKAVEDALYYSGHDPYNGTISTTGGFFVAAREPMTIRQARRMVRQYQDYEQNSYEWADFKAGYGKKPRKRIANPFGRTEIEKWGPVAAIPIKRSNDSPRGWLFYGLAAM